MHMYAQAIEPPLDAVDPSSCFHCGLLVPAGVRLIALVDGIARPMCCYGCQAVAQAIAEVGLADYYRYRTAPAASQRDVSIPAELRIFDDEEVQRTFVHEPSERVKEAALILECITCAACVWLNERHIAALPGVLSVEINYATRRVRVTWNEARIKLSAILQAISAIGLSRASLRCRALRGCTPP